MRPLPDDIKYTFFSFLSGNIAVADFEQWVYQTVELVALLEREDYHELLAFDYRGKAVGYKLDSLIERQINLGEFETWKLRNLLFKVKNNEGDLVQNISDFYAYYCKGYSFLDKLGLNYGLSIMVPPSNYRAETWQELSSIEKQHLLASFYPEILVEIDKVLGWLDEGKVILTGKPHKNYANMMEFIDHR